MYGLLLEGIADAIRRKWGEEIWQRVRTKAGIPHHTFVMHKTYSETVIPRIAKAASEICDRPLDDLMEFCGMSFVGFIGQYGYDRILRVLGRHLRDFLNGLDNLHEYLRFSYPKLKPPSFFVEDESRTGLTLHYRSKRRGFVYYVMGQITSVARDFYNQPIEIEIEMEEETLDMTHIELKLHFDNTAYRAVEEEAGSVENILSIDSELLFDVFPFHIVFGSSMFIKSVGHVLAKVMNQVLGNSVDEMFTLNRPLVEFTYENVLSHLNNVFEIISMDPVRRNTSVTTTLEEIEDEEADERGRRLKLKGQMIYMEKWNAVLFLGTPVMDSLDKMFDNGLFINDLSMHDSSRDLVLAGTQQSADLKAALDQEKRKSRMLESTLRKLDVEEKQKEAVCMSMVPRLIVEKLGNGEQSADCCKSYGSASVLCSDIVAFNTIVEKSPPRQVAAMMNQMMMKFDHLVNKYSLFHMKSSGDSYIVCSGVPVPSQYHAINICALALEMNESVKTIPDPSNPDKSIKVKIGVCSGPVSAVLHGTKQPRFDIFGETVMTAKHLAKDVNSDGILIGSQTRNEIEGFDFHCEEYQSSSPGQAFALRGRGDQNLPTEDMDDMYGNVTGFISANDEDIDISKIYKPLL